jgi:tetratricopeptide (TPR) repeat protein
MNNKKAKVRILAFGATLVLAGSSSALCAQSSSGAQQPAAQSNSQQSQSSPSGPAPSLQKSQAPPSAPPQLSPQEKQDFTAIENEKDPNKQFQLVKDFQQKYPNSTLLSNALFFGVGAAEQRNDVPDAVNFAEESVKLQPNNLRSLILLCGLLPLPQALQGNAQQKAQQLTESESDANRALQLLNSLQPAPNVPPAQFGKEKSMIAGELHAALGMAHLERAVLNPASAGAPTASELAAAEQEFKTAVASPEPNVQDYYRLGEVYTRENKIDEAIGAFSQAAQLGQGTLMQKLASARIAQLQAAKAKSTAAPPAKQ